MFVQNIDPNLVTIGPFSIRFYGIVYALGFLLVSYLLEKKAGKIKNLTKERAFDLVAFTMVFALAGARLFHVLEQFSYYRENLWQVFMIWKGGLAFFGGISFGLAAMYFYCRKKDIDFFKVIDVISLWLPLVTAFGRIANFINSEHMGFPSNLPWCVVYQRVDDICRHPVQLYESISQFMIFAVLLVYSKKQRNDGNIAWMYMILYGAFRFVTDFFRESFSVYLLGMSNSQVLSVLVISLGAWMIKNEHSRKKPVHRKESKG